ncbi:hypothetical protein SDJN03_22818, partial [Cucurbita argyrosperma subsp. sororia]
MDWSGPVRPAQNLKSEAILKLQLLHYFLLPPPFGIFSRSHRHPRVTKSIGIPVNEGQNFLRVINFPLLILCAVLARFKLLTVLGIEVSVRNMEKAAIDSASDGEEEYVLIDLGDVSLLDIPPNAPYVLSGLDTMSPILTICDKIKMIGEYEETIGTCLAFAEEEVSMVEEEAVPSKTNRRSEKAVEPNQALRKDLKPVASVHKILKFKLLDSVDSADSAVPDSTS